MGYPIAYTLKPTAGGKWKLFEGLGERERDAELAVFDDLEKAEKALKTWLEFKRKPRHYDDEGNLIVEEH